MESAQIEFLWKAMALLPGNQEACNVLRCHFMSACRSLDGVGDAKLPTKYTQKSAMCQYCSNMWKNGKCSTKVVPERKRPASIRKIISRYNKDPSCLRKFEVGLAKKYARRKNTLVVTCGICHKETKLDLFKPEKKIKPENESYMEEPQSETKKKKKRCSRDRTAGLIIPPDTQKKVDKIKKATGCFNSNESDSKNPSVGHTSSKKAVENQKSCVAKEFVNSKSKKKKKETLKDASELLSVKNHYTPKIMKNRDDSSRQSAITKLVKNKKMGNMFSCASSSSESPLSKFLSSL
ncbi:uncharacterized protein [Hetaerina americana]|uniref:uncharacterized protein n=1 Tax=Hetaerina americana TaxID=62018 RepID=UPI003A7F283B